MYEPRQRLSSLYLTAQEKIYAKVSILVALSSSEYIPYPLPGDIIITDKGESGKDVEIRLRVYGSVSENTKYQELIIPVEILDPGQDLDEQGIKNAIGNQVFNITTKVYKNNVPLESTTGTISQNSDIEIE